MVSRPAPRRRPARALDRHRNRPPPHHATACAPPISMAPANAWSINAALTGPTAAAPDYRDQTPLVFYVPGEWKRRVISTENSRRGARNLRHRLGRQRPRRASSPPASPASISSNSPKTTTGRAPKSPRAIPPRGPNPAPAISPWALRRARSDKTRFLAAIEPWHGNQVAVYTPARRAVGARSHRYHAWSMATPSRSPTSTAMAWTKSSPASAVSRAASISIATTPPPSTGRAAISIMAAWAPRPAPSPTSTGRPPRHRLHRFPRRLKWYENAPAR